MISRGWLIAWSARRTISPGCMSGALDSGLRLDSSESLRGRGRPAPCRQTSRVKTSRSPSCISTGATSIAARSTMCSAGAEGSSASRGTRRTGRCSAKPPSTGTCATGQSPAPPGKLRPSNSAESWSSMLSSAICVPSEKSARRLKKTTGARSASQRSKCSNIACANCRPLLLDAGSCASVPESSITSRTFRIGKATAPGTGASGRTRSAFAAPPRSTTWSPSNAASEPVPRCGRWRDCTDFKLFAVLAPALPSLRCPTL